MSSAIPGPTLGARNSALLLATVLTTAGVAHFVRPGLFDRLIPPVLPGPPRAWTYGSGVAELGVAALVLAPRTRRTGGLLAAGLFAAVLPGNAQMTVDAYRQEHGTAYRLATIARLPLQLPLIRWGLQVGRRAEG